MPHAADVWLEGTALASSADTLMMKVGGAETMALALSSVKALEVSSGKSRDRGAMLGAAIGFVGGNIYHKLINPPEYRCINERDYNGGCDDLFFLMMDGISGAPFGLLVGLIVFADERWEPVSLPLHVGLSERGEMRVALRFAFGK